METSIKLYKYRTAFVVKYGVVLPGGAALLRAIREAYPAEKREEV
jgi:hypothetical protein